MTARFFVRAAQAYGQAVAGDCEGDDFNHPVKDRVDGKVLEKVFSMELIAAIRLCSSRCSVDIYA